MANIATHAISPALYKIPYDPMKDHVAVALLGTTANVLVVPSSTPARTVRDLVNLAKEPVQFELTEPTRAAVAAWIEKAKLKPEQCLFPSRLSNSPHVSTRQYARIVDQWVAAICAYRPRRSAFSARKTQCGSQ